MVDTDLVIFECHAYMKKKFKGPGTTHHEIAYGLDSLGFDVYKIYHEYLLKINGIHYHPIYDEKPGWQNCFAIKRDYAYRSEILDRFPPLCGYKKFDL